MFVHNPIRQSISQGGGTIRHIDPETRDFLINFQQVNINNAFRRNICTNWINLMHVIWIILMDIPVQTCDLF